MHQTELKTRQLSLLNILHWQQLDSRGCFYGGSLVPSARAQSVHESVSCKGRSSHIVDNNSKVPSIFGDVLLAKMALSR